MTSTFLNLEQDQKSHNVLDTVINEKGVHMSIEGVLTVITEFYMALYANQDSQTEQEIMNFLDSVPSFPRILHDTTLLTMPISEEEVTKAIRSLRLGKALGCDGLMAEFYKLFEESLLPILMSLFVAIWENKQLTDTQ